MKEHSDPFEVLAGVDPLDHDAVAGARSSVRAQATLDRILAQPTRTGGRSRRGRLYALAAVAAAIPAAGAAWALTNEPTHRLEIGCYAANSLDATTVVVDAGDASPVAACRAAWSRGELGGPAPRRLEACVLPSGAIGVFPETCRQLKLTPVGRASAHAPPSNGSPTALKRSLVGTYLSRRCLGRRAGIAAARAAIGANGLTDWRVHVTTPFTPLRSCTSFAFDEVGHLVLLVPIPPRP
jgi:hypothetical protein